MNMKTYNGTVVIEVDGIEYDTEKFNETEETGRKPVKPMTRTGRSPGFTPGVGTIELTMTVLVPQGIPQPDWAQVTDAVVTMSPQNKPDDRTTWTGCYTTKKGMSTSGEDAMKIDITMMATDKFKE